MKNIKCNIFKGIIGVACAVLPLQKAHAQYSGNVRVVNERVYGAGASYTVLDENNIYGFGANVNWGVASVLRPVDDNFYGCATFVLHGDISRFNNKENLYKICCVLRLGAGYKRVALVYVNENGLYVDKSSNLSLINGHGVGVDVSLGDYTKLYLDYTHYVPKTDKVKTEQRQLNQKNVVRIGFIFTIVRKEERR